MPAQIETGLFCADYVGEFHIPNSKGDGHYVVTLDVMGGNCTCPGFRYRRDCKHMKRVWKEACLWNCQWHEGGTDELSPVDYHPSYPRLDDPDNACPHCGGPTIPVKIAV